MSPSAVARDRLESPVSLPASSLGTAAALGSFQERINVIMTKSIDSITEIVRNPKPSFRKADDRPAKAQRHRYERRKIKEYMKLSDWGQEAPA